MFKLFTILGFCFIQISCFSSTNLTLDEAQRKMSNKRYEEAKNLFKIYLEKNTRDSEAWYQLGISYAESKDFANMNKSFSQSVKFNSKNIIKIKDFTERKFTYYLEKISDNLSIYKRLDNIQTLSAQKLATEIHNDINTAHIIYPNDKRIPDIVSPDFVKNEIHIEEKQFEKLRNSNLAMINLSGNNISKGTASAVTSRLFQELFKRNFYVLLEREKIESILKEQSFQLSGCMSSECLVEIGRLLNVQLMLGGAVSKIGDFYMIDLRLIDVESGKIILTANEDFKGSFENFIKISLPKVTNKLTIYGR